MWTDVIKYIAEILTTNNNDIPSCNSYDVFQDVIQDTLVEDITVLCVYGWITETFPDQESGNLFQYCILDKNAMHIELHTLSKNYTGSVIHTS